MLLTQAGRMFKAITTFLTELFNFSITSGSIPQAICSLKPMQTIPWIIGPLSVISTAMEGHITYMNTWLNRNCSQMHGVLSWRIYSYSSSQHFILWKIVLISDMFFDLT